MAHLGLVPNPVAVNCCVPEGFRVAKLGLTLNVGAEDVLNVMFALAVCAAFAILATVSTMVCRALIVTGAVYTPFVIVPTDGASDHVTAVVGVPPMETLNWVDWPPVREVEEGVSAMPTVDTSVIVALLVLVGSAKLVAVTVTVCWLLIVAGAW